MKITFLWLLFLVIAFLISLSAYNALPDSVLDITGKNLRLGIDYHVVPVFHSRGDGLTLASTGNETCPLDVVQEQQDVNNGLPLTFIPVNPNKGVICVSTDLNIKFSAATVCIQSTVWKLGYDESLPQYFITSGGVEGNPGRKIEKYEKDYKLLFCPTVCDSCRVICIDVGIFIKSGKWRLALSDRDVPFKVMFKKA